MSRNYEASIMKRLAFVLMLLASNGAAAQDQKTIRALNNLHDEMLACIAYYTIGHACTKDQVPPEITESTTAAIESLTEGSYEIGQMLGMTDDAMTSRLKMRADEMRRLANDSCVNFSSLLNRYADRCQRVTQSPDPIFDEYMK